MEKEMLFGILRILLSFLFGFFLAPNYLVLQIACLKVGRPFCDMVEKERSVNMKRTRRFFIMLLILSVIFTLGLVSLMHDMLRPIESLSLLLGLLISTLIKLPDIGFNRETLKSCLAESINSYSKADRQKIKDFAAVVARRKQ